MSKTYDETREKMDNMAVAARGDKDPKAAMAGYLDNLHGELKEASSKLEEAIAAGSEPTALQAIADRLNAVAGGFNPNGVMEAIYDSGEELNDNQHPGSHPGNRQQAPSNNKSKTNKTK